MQDIERLVRALCAQPTELEYVEFKHNFSEAKKEGRDISALANAAAYHQVPAAYKVWGVDDGTHEIVGTEFKPKVKKVGNQELELWLRLALSQNAHFEFMEEEIDGKPTVVLKVWPAFGQPVQFENIAYIRTGTATQKLEHGSTREMELWRRVQREVFEDQIALEDLTIAEVLERIDAAAYFSMLEMRYPDSPETVMHYLAEEGLVRKQADGLFSIANVGALLFARDVDEFPTIRRKTPRVIQYQGTSRVAMVKEHVFKRGYAVGFAELFNYIMALIPSRETIDGPFRTSLTQYPSIALRELLANALIHQDLRLTGMSPLIELFDDRIEITNPGSPLVEVDRLVNDPPRSRNEKLSALMRRLGICEEAGTGWDKIIMACEESRLPAPRIEVHEEASMRVTLRRPVAYRDLTMRERLDACYWHACLCYASGTYASNASLRERFGMGASGSAQVSRLIKEAVTTGRIKAVDPDTAPRYLRYEPGWA